MIELNLLPQARKQYLHQRQRNRTVTGVGVGIIAMLLLTVAALFGATIYIGSLVSSNKARVEQAQDDLARYATIEQAVLSIRDRVSSLVAQEKSRLDWAALYEELANAVPPGVQLTQSSLTTTSVPHLQVSGNAENKEKVATLRERLDFSDTFEEVAIRQVGEAENEAGLPITTFSMEANLTGVALPTQAKKPAGVGE